MTFRWRHATGRRVGDDERDTLATDLVSLVRHDMAKGVDPIVRVCVWGEVLMVARPAKAAEEVDVFDAILYRVAEHEPDGPPEPVKISARDFIRTVWETAKPVCEAPKPNRTHELKTWPTPFAAVRSGEKTTEVRKNDRAFAVGDRLILLEFVPCGWCQGSGLEPKAVDCRKCSACGVGNGITSRGSYTGEAEAVTVTHIQRGFGLPDDVVVMSIMRREQECLKCVRCRCTFDSPAPKSWICERCAVIAGSGLA